MTKVVWNMTPEERDAWTARVGNAPPPDQPGFGDLMGPATFRPSRTIDVPKTVERCVDCGSVVGTRADRTRPPRCRVHYLEQYRKDNPPAPRGRDPSPVVPKFCIDCGAQIAQVSTRCVHCAGKYRARERHLEILQEIALARLAELGPVIECNLEGCSDEATESGRCIRHEALWQRLNGPDFPSRTANDPGPAQDGPQATEDRFSGKSYG